MISLAGTKCKFRFIYARFNCKRKNQGKNLMGKVSLEGRSVGSINLDQINKTLPKAQRTRGLSSAYQSNFFLVISQVQTQNLIKFHLKNIDQAPNSKSRHQQTSASRLNLKFKILSKPGFAISTKIQHHYLYKTSAEKY